MTCYVCGCAPIDGLAGCGLCGRCRTLPGVTAGMAAVAERHAHRGSGAAREGVDAMSVSE